MESANGERATEARWAGNTHFQDDCMTYLAAQLVSLSWCSGQRVVVE